MKVTLKSTQRIVDINGVQARVWEGESESGLEVFALVPKIAIIDEDPEVRLKFDDEMADNQEASQESYQAFSDRIIAPSQ